MATSVKYPDITVQLTGADGNAFAVLGAVRRALKRHGVSRMEELEFHREATSGDYDHLLKTCMEWIVVE